MAGERPLAWYAGAIKKSNGPGHPHIVAINRVQSLQERDQVEIPAWTR